MEPRPEIENEREYRASLEAYGASLRTADGQARQRLQRADAARLQLNVAMPPEEQVSDEMHTVLAFSYAVEADAKSEAEYLYDMMSSEQQAVVDAADDASPGRTKIWLAERLDGNRPERG